jgi:hypothetical protein
MRRNFAVVGVDVGALAVGVEQVAVGLAVGADAVADAGLLLIMRIG